MSGKNGDPNSYDPSLIGGTVIRSEPEILNPEGNFMEYIPPKPSISETPSVKPTVYCKYCGVILENPSVQKCPSCGSSQS